MSDLRYCHHCDETLPRRTVYSHLKRNRKRGRDEDIDVHRDRRCRDSSDEDDCITKEGSAQPRDGSYTDLQSEDNDRTDQDSDDEVDETGSSTDDGDDPICTSHQEYKSTCVWEDETAVDIDRDVASEKEPFVNGYEQQTEVMKFVNWILSCLLVLQCSYSLSDRCIEHIMLLFKQLFNLLGRINSFVLALGSVFPVSLYMFRKMTNFDRDNFTKFLVCPNCTAIYKYGEIVKERDGSTFALKCPNLVWGCRTDNTSENFRKRGKHRCNAVLVQEVQLQDKSTRFYPLKVFSYRSVIDSLETLLSRPDFKEKCNNWRGRQADDIYGDIYDGKIWQDFQTHNGEPFLRDENNFAAMINVDWFQPFKRRSDYSVGVLYMVFMNLPRSERFKMENVLLLGIIPALKKEPNNLNSFLGPLVDELKVLSTGICLKIAGNEEVKVKLLLLCAASDIPAARKLSGFMGHSAIQGCSFCEIRFLDKDGNRYCGPVSEIWKSRCREDHLRMAKKAEQATSLTEKEQIHKTTGYKYTKLLDLDYFQPSRFTVVEPMHNLFLGTARKLFITWVDREILTKPHLEAISERIVKMNVSSDIGRLPINIASNYSAFTAEEWKNWVLVYSLYCLHNLLAEEHLKVWQKFVLACRHLCQPTIQRSRLRVAHRLFLVFARDAEILYGANFLTPNMHLHGHLKETVENYGSLYGFWAFSFERYNGFLADFPTNKRSIELQIMRKFAQIGFAADLKHKDLGEGFNEAFWTFSHQSLEPAKPTSRQLHAMVDLQMQDVDKSLWTDLSVLSLKQEGYKIRILSTQERQQIAEALEVMYGSPFPVQEVTSLAKVYPSVYWKNELLSSDLSARGGSSKMIMAKWAREDSSIADGFTDSRPGRIMQYILHTVEMEGKHVDHLFAVVSWYKSCEDSLGYLPPLSVWSTKEINDGPSKFVPVQRISSKCGYAVEKRGRQSFLIVTPSMSSIFI